MWIELAAIFGLVLTNIICYLCHDDSLVRRKLKGPKLLFVSNRSDTSANTLPTEYWAFDILDATQLVSSYFLNDVGVLLLRCLSFGFFVVTLLLEGLTDDGFGRPLGWLTFFTNWTFLLLGIWSGFGLVITARHLQNRISWYNSEAAVPEEEQQLTGREGHSSQSPGARHPHPTLQWRWWSVGFVLMTQTVATSTLFLSAFYWIFIYNPKYRIQVDNLLKHGVNNIVLLLEVFLIRTPFVSFHFQVIILYGTVYTVFMWIYHAASLHWVYWILDWSKPTALVLYLLNPLFLYLGFVFWYGVANLREWLGIKYCTGRTSISPGQISSQQHV